jgi:hypothetical protein
VTHHLICIEHFGPYAKGDKITAPDEVARVLDSPQHHHVVKVNAPDEPAPAPPRAELPAVSFADGSSE